LLTAVGLTPGGSSTAHIYTNSSRQQTTQETGRFPRFRAHTKMTAQVLLVNTCFTCRSLCIHAAQL